MVQKNVLCQIAVALTVGFLASRSIQPVWAQTVNGSLQIEPAFQELSISDEQASVSGQLTLTNHSTEPLAFEIFAVDIKQFDADGRVVLADKPATGTDYSVAEFIEFPSQSWDIPADSSQTIPFVVKNAPKLSPGGHYASLIARLRPRETTHQQVLPALSSFVFIKKVGGELYHLSLVNPETTFPAFWWSVPHQIPLTLSNQGNIHVTPRGLLEITTPWNQVVFHGIVNESSLFVFPGSQRTIPVTLTNRSFNWPMMLYRIALHARSEPGDVTITQTSWVLVVEPWAVLAGGLTGAGVGVLVWHQRKQRKTNHDAT